MSAPSHPQRSQALAMLIGATAFWGLSFPLNKAIMFSHVRLLPASGHWFITAQSAWPRFALALIILAAFRFRDIRALTRSEWRQGLVLGLFSAAGLLFQIDGLQFTAASTSAFLTQLYAILIPIWFAVRRRRNPGASVWLSAVLVLAGVAVLARLDWRDLRLGRGEAETLLGSVFFMGQILCLERKEFSANRVLPMTAAMFAVEAAIFVAVALAAAGRPAELFVPWGSGAWTGFTVVLTMLCTLCAFIIMNVWQPKITATEAGLVYCIEPVFASLLALFLPAWFGGWGVFVYPNETAGLNLLVGGGLITAANVLIQLKPPREEMG
ncbi:MAG: DMT family transporter [Opitutaceae bacterium]|jgi:drug/metabolite transporter (DMT)-like permease